MTRPTMATAGFRQIMRKRTERQIDYAGFQPKVKVLGITLNHLSMETQANSGSTKNSRKRASVLLRAGCARFSTRAAFVMLRSVIRRSKTCG